MNGARANPILHFYYSPDETERFVAYRALCDSDPHALARTTMGIPLDAPYESIQAVVRRVAAEQPRFFLGADGATMIYQTTNLGIRGATSTIIIPPLQSRSLHIRPGVFIGARVPAIASQKPLDQLICAALVELFEEQGFDSVPSPRETIPSLLLP